MIVLSLNHQDFSFIEPGYKLFIPFMTIRSWITLGSKYKVEGLRRKAGRQMDRLYGFDTFKEHQSMQSRRNKLFKDVGRMYGDVKYGHIEVVNLARSEAANGRPELLGNLPFVFYECSRMSIDDLLLAEGGLPSLCPKDLAILLKGKEELIDRDLDFLKKLVAYTPTHACTDFEHCLKQSRLLINDHWSDIVKTAGSLLSHRPSIEKLISRSGICKGCRKKLGDSLSAHCDNLWEYLGDVFKVDLYDRGVQRAGEVESS